MAKRNGSEGSALDPALSQKKRARRRLIGAAALALAAAIVLPLLLDSEPRQQPPDVEVEIPSRDTPLRPPPALDATAGQAEAETSGEPADPARGASGQAPAKADAAAARGSDAAPAVAPAPAPAVTPAPAPSRPSSPAKAPVEPAKAAAKPPAPAQAPAQAPAAPAEPPPRAAAQVPGQFVLQIGAWANPASARSMMERARKAGVRAYTEQVSTQAGPRTRVRVGPFTDRESAERARGKLKLVGIDSSLVALP